LINSEIHNISTSHSSNLHLPSANLDIYPKRVPKRVDYSGVKIFNSLLFNIKKFSNNLRTFKSVLKHLLQLNSFYSLAEYYNNNSKFVWY